MYFKEFYLGCLAHASYLIGGSDGTAAVVDPQRDVDLYLEDAAHHGLTIRHVIETHLHADFVSGHIELAARTGARIYFGWRATASFDFVPVHDGEAIALGDTVLRFWETPGHTPESISVLVCQTSGSGEPEAVLTGDALFIGDVGRPDLLSGTMSAAELASTLYDSLRKLLTLPDHVKVFPAHGAGSLCGRNISSERSSTIGHERRFNYALKPMSKGDFVRLMTVDLPEAPSYFRRDVDLNRRGAALLGTLRDLPPLNPGHVLDAAKAGHRVLDTRSSNEYGAAHIPDSLNIGLGGQFATWCGTLLDPATPIIIVAESEEGVTEARLRLARVGLEDVAGFLSGGLQAWEASGLPLARTEQISVDELQARLQGEDPPNVLDVRRLAEWNSGHIDRALHVPLHVMKDHLAAIPQTEPLAVICAGGYRSIIAAGILEQRGFIHIANVIGGMTAWTLAGFDVNCEPSAGL